MSKLKPIFQHLSNGEHLKNLKVKNLKVFKLLDILPGYCFNLSAKQFHKKRLINIEFKSSERAKKIRKTLRSLKKKLF